MQKLSSRTNFRTLQKKKMHFCLIKWNRNRIKASPLDFLMTETRDLPLINRITNKIGWWDVTSMITSHRIVSEETLSLASFDKVWSNWGKVHVTRQWGQQQPEWPLTDSQPIWSPWSYNCKKLYFTTNHICLGAGLSPTECRDETPTWPTPCLSLWDLIQRTQWGLPWLLIQGNNEIISVCCFKLLIM